MKWGLIARADHRGLAYQSHVMYREMKPSKTLIVTDVNPQFPDDIGMYRNAPDVSKVSYRNGTLDEKTVRKFLTGLDVVWAHETLYDWRMADWAREMGVKTIVQANPELFTHHRDNLPHPDRWCYPTDWMLNEGPLPDGPVIPNPIPMPPVSAGDPTAPVINILHVAGHAAVGDRNGTNIFFEALPTLRRKFKVTVVGQDGRLPHHGRLHPDVELVVNPKGVQDRWEMYQDQHIVVLPRRYGGGSIPAVETLAVGAVLVMPNCPPNDTWPGPRLTSRKGRLQRVKFGTIETSMVHPMEIGHVLNGMFDDRDRLAAAMEASRSFADTNAADALYDFYYRPFMEAVVAGKPWS